MLAVLFVLRATIAFQFQSVAAVGPVLGREFGIGIAELGVLIGLYFAPGVLLAVPGGALGSRLGDKRTVLAGVGLMIAGACLMAIAPSWTSQAGGRIVAGAGGVFLNIVLAKMVADWFAGREIATAMAIFVNSWPAGVALALVALPPIATSSGVGAAHIVVAAATAFVGLVAVAIYRAPADVAVATRSTARVSRAAAAAVLAAGAIWALYNVGFAMVFSFGPALLVERGWSVPAAGSATSIILWLAVASVPLGGFLADRTQRSGAVLVAGCAAFGVLLFAAARGTPTIPTFVLLGLVCGLAAGPIMSLPALVLGAATRTLGMGLFYAVYYAAMMLGPALAGYYASFTGTAAGALDFGAALLLACPLLLVAFRAGAARVARAGA